jgi:hypothetical protein
MVDRTSESSECAVDREILKRFATSAELVVSSASTMRLTIASRAVRWVVCARLPTWRAGGVG